MPFRPSRKLNLANLASSCTLISIPNYTTSKSFDSPYPLYATPLKFHCGQRACTFPPLSVARLNNFLPAPFSSLPFARHKHHAHFKLTSFSSFSTHLINSASSHVLPPSALTSTLTTGPSSPPGRAYPFTSVHPSSPTSTLLSFAGTAITELTGISWIAGTRCQ